MQNLPVTPKLVVDLEWQDIFDRFVVLWLCIFDTLSKSPAVTNADLGLLGNDVLPFSLKTDASWYPELSELFLEWQIVRPFSAFLHWSSETSEMLLEGFSSVFLRISSDVGAPSADRCDSWESLRLSSFSWTGGLGAGLRFLCGGLGRSGGGGSFFGDIIIFCWIAGGVTDLESSLWVGEIDRVSLEIDPEHILWKKGGTYKRNRCNDRISCLPIFLS